MGLRPIAAGALRAVLSLSKRAGIDVVPARHRSNRIIGFRAQWRDDDPGAVRGVIVERLINGTLVRFFISDEGDGIQSLHAAGLWYEEPDLVLIAELFEGGAFVDVGANVGNHSLYAALVLKADKVIAFEPNPLAYRTCRYNFLLNAVDAQLHTYGLADQTGRATVARTQHRNLGATRLAAGDGTLELRRGDDVLRGEKVGFIKIDVEGMEMSVLAGLEETILTHRPPMLVEVEEANREVFDEYVASLGYIKKTPKPMCKEKNVLLVPSEP